MGDRGPFTLPTPKTTECANLKWCFGIRGLWVAIPRGGEATWLFGCPPRSLVKGKFLLGGTDALLSSNDVRVWYEGQLGAPVGGPNPGVGLLFHATTRSGAVGSFQPILGCISLSQAIGRSTLAVTPHAAGSSLVPRAKNIILEPGSDRAVDMSCLKKETIVGSWNAFAFGTQNPPDVPPPGAITVTMHQGPGVVLAVIETKKSVPYLIHIQVGLLCQS